MPVNTSSPSDSDLLHRAIQGDTNAYGNLYERYLDEVYRYVYYRVADQHTAEDLTEIAFVKAWEALPRLKSLPQNVRAWIYRIAHNTVIDHYRTRKTSFPLEQAENLADEVPQPETALQSLEEKQQLALAIKQLKPQFQQVLVCRFINGLSHAETARIMGLSKNHVRVIQYRALQKIREILTSLSTHEQRKQTHS